MIEPGLGRRPASDDAHIRKYSLAADATPATPTPLVLGIAWPFGFDKAGLREFDGGVWVGRSPLGKVRGGHAICLKPPALDDPKGAYEHHNQGEEGRCVGEAWTRASALVEGRLFDPESLFQRAQAIDEFDDTPPESGTSVRAGGAVAQKEGLHLVRNNIVAKRPSSRWKIGAYFWATSVEQIVACLHGDMALGYVEFLNSWGAGYPHITRMSHELLHQMVFERDGDAAIAVNRPRQSGLAA